MHQWLHLSLQTLRTSGDMPFMHFLLVFSRMQYDAWTRVLDRHMSDTLGTQALCVCTQGLLVCCIRKLLQ